MAVNHVKRCAKVETVGELKEFLASLDKDMDVVFPTNNGWDFVTASVVGIDSHNDKEHYALCLFND